MPSVFEGVRVIDWSQGIAGPVAALLLAEQGADVVKVEPPGGDRARGLPGFHVWNRSKRGVTADPASDGGRETLRRLARAADVLVADAAPPELARLGLTYEDLAAENPALIFCHVPPYGSRGPHAGRPPLDDLAAALNGLMGTQWSTRGGPVYLVSPIGSYGTALLAAGAVSAALYAREHTGRGQRLEVSWIAGGLALETGAAIRGASVQRVSSGAMAADPATNNPLGPVPVYRLFQAADGRWLFIACGNATFWSRLALVLDRPDLLADPRYAAAPWGIPPEHRLELAGLVQAAIATRPREEWLRILEEADIPCAPVLTRAEFMEDPQVRHLGLRVEVEDPELGHTVQVGVPVEFRGMPGAVRGPAPRLGQHTAEVLADPAWARPPAALPARGGRDGDRCGPLAGVRVIDLTSYIAGSLCPMMLADYGADVVKVEFLEGDAFRSFGYGFLGWNRGKRGLAVQLKHPKGRELVHRLVRDADVVVENYRPGVARRLGLDYETLRAVNPRLIYASVNAYGDSGPYVEKPGFDPLIQARSGLMAAQGGPGNPPVYYTCAVCDYAGAQALAFAVCAALYARERTGAGQHVATSLTAMALLAQSGDFIFYEGKPPEPPGGPDLLGRSATYRHYRCADGWLFLALTEPDGWPALAAALGRPELAAGCPGREAVAAPAEGPLAAALEQAFAAEPVAAWLERLDRAGIPVAPVLNIAALFDDPHIRANDLMAEHQHPLWGTVHQTGLLVKFSETPGVLQRPAPLLGQHNREVLREAGLSEEEIDALAAEGIIGSAQR
ncbi:MAG TPA: CoA transferase [Dehalococcoidia bacterium]